MKYSVCYRKDFKYHNEIDEYYIFYKPNFEALERFVLGMKEEGKTVVIKMNKERMDSFIENKEILELSEITPNFKIELDWINEEVMKQLKKMNIPYFLSIPAYDRDSLISMMNMGVSEIIICGTLGFDFKRVSEYTKEKGIKLRAIPDICQASWYVNDDFPSYQLFFIRPEDVPVYEEYIDTLSFSHDTQEELYYKIYAKDKKWFGDLSEIITGLPEDVYKNQSIIPIFGEKRANCNKKCQYGEGCHICSSITNLANNMIENNLIVKY